MLLHSWWTLSSIFHTLSTNCCLLLIPLSRVVLYSQRLCYTSVILLQHLSTFWHSVWDVLNCFCVIIEHIMHHSEHSMHLVMPFCFPSALIVAQIWHVFLFSSLIYLCWKETLNSELTDLMESICLNLKVRLVSMGQCCSRYFRLSNGASY